MDVNFGADAHALDQRAASKSGPRFCVRPPANKNIARHGNGAVGDDEDFEGGAFERVELGDAINLLLYWAGVGVDVDGDGFRPWRRIHTHGRLHAAALRYAPFLRALYISVWMKLMTPNAVET
jgi:hypothetical protein